MIPWDDDIDVYYFTQEYTPERAIWFLGGPVQKCLWRHGITTSYYGPQGSLKKNIRFRAYGRHMLSAFPAYRKKDRIDFVSQSVESRRSSMPKADIFPLQKYPFHDYHVHLPHNIEKYLEVDWSRNQLDEFK